MRSLTFRPVGRPELPLLEAWLRSDHVARWWDHAGDLEAKHCGNERPVRSFIVLDHQHPVGFIQEYYWEDLPADAARVRARVGEIGIDYLLGDPDAIGSGLGPEMIEAFLDTFTRGRGDVCGVRVEVAAANRRSWRALEKCGFTREPGPPTPLTEAGMATTYVYTRNNRPARTFDPDVVSAIAGRVRSAAPPPPMTTRVVAIDGPGGAGKSTLAVLLSERLGRAPIIHTDDFSSADNTIDWYPRLLEQVLIPLADRCRARYQRYDWDRERLAEWHELDHGGVIILEGVTASRRAFRPYLTYTVWVKTARELRLRRGLDRNGPASLPLWREWQREEDLYMSRERPEGHADCVISGAAALHDGAVGDPLWD